MNFEHYFDQNVTWVTVRVAKCPTFGRTVLLWKQMSSVLLQHLVGRKMSYFATLGFYTKGSD